MKWNCPECGLENSDKFLECTCGYAFYKILGVTPGASRKEVDQTYQYLKKVWNKNIQSQDPSLKKKAQDRLNKIEEAYGIYKQFVTGVHESEKKPSHIKIASIAGVVIIVLTGILIFFYVTRKDVSHEQNVRVQSTDKVGEQYMPEGVPDRYSEEEYKGQEIQPYDRPTPDITSMTEEERAIEMVKRSRGIDRFYADESRISNWEAREIDDQRYIVSFTASKGSDTSAFYFEANTETGSVRPITDRSELQAYGIQQAAPDQYRLDVTVPEYVRENTGFEVRVMITGKPNMKMSVSKKMFFIVSNGCDVTAIQGTAPRRMSDLMPGYHTVKGTMRDPYIPSDEFVVLNSQGNIMIPVSFKADTYSDRLPRVGAGSEDRGCILEVSIGSFAKVETWVVIEAE